MEPEKAEKIRERAYALWEREGRPQGRHDAHWEEARRQVEAEEAAGAEAGEPLKVTAFNDPTRPGGPVEGRPYPPETAIGARVEPAAAQPKRQRR